MEGGPGIVHHPGVGPGVEPGVGGQLHLMVTPLLLLLMVTSLLLLLMVTPLLARTLLAPAGHGPRQLAHLPVI